MGSDVSTSRVYPSPQSQDPAQTAPKVARSCASANESLALADFSAENHAALGQGKREERGLSFAALLRVARRAQATDPQMSTADVAKLIVVADTSARRCSYLELLPPVDVAHHQYFVSHRWGAPFSETVEALARFLQVQGVEDEAAAEVFVWMDLFCVNQHSVGGGFGDVAALLNLRESITSAGSTLLCLDSHGIVLTRIWCLYEIWMSYQVGGGQKLHVLSSASESDKLKEVLITLDVAKAEARFEADRQRILQDIAATVGTQEMNMIIKEALVQSTELELQQADAAAGAVLPYQPDAPQLLFLADVLDKRALFLETMGEFDDAQPLYERALRIIQDARGPDHKETAQHLSHVACLFMAQGEYRSAQPLLERALQVMERVLGPDDVGMAEVASNLGAVCCMVGDYRKAQQLWERVLRIRENAFGLGDVEVAATVNNLAIMLGSQGRFDEAEALFERALYIREHELGKDHPDTADSFNNLACTLKDLGRYQEALPLANAALEIREKAFGANHPKVAASLNTKASVLVGQGTLDEARRLYERALLIWEQSDGDGHADVANGLSSLARLLCMQGKYAEALPYLDRAVGLREEVLGPYHPATVQARAHLKQLRAELRR